MIGIRVFYMRGGPIGYRQQLSRVGNLLVREVRMISLDFWNGFRRWQVAARRESLGPAKFLSLGLVLFAAPLGHKVWGEFCELDKRPGDQAGILRRQQYVAHESGLHFPAETAAAAFRCHAPLYQNSHWLAISAV
jgi:hypothetical protein